jgi:hypothetical protein
MSSFPLYDNLNQQTENVSEMLSSIDKTMLSENIKKIDNDGHKMIYALIRYFQMKHSQNNGIDLPYSSKKQKSGYKFDIDCLPQQLQQILFMFSKIHLNKMKEDLILHTPQK